MVFLKVFRKQFFHLTGLCIAMLLLISPLAWLSVTHPQNLQNMGDIIAHNIALFTGFRWLLILGFFFFWKPVIECVGKRRQWSAEVIQFWLNQRFKITIWLVLFELVLCDNLLLKAIHLLEGLV